MPFTMKHILKCTKCGSYGLNEKCDCGSIRIEPRPPKFSPQDKYGAYRREAKKLENNTEDNIENDTENE